MDLPAFLAEFRNLTSLSIRISVMFNLTARFVLLPIISVELIPRPYPVRYQLNGRVIHTHQPTLVTKPPLNLIGNWSGATTSLTWYTFDYQLGQVLDLLETKGRDQNTYIVFLSDHGELLADHGFTGKEERHYDPCIRVPLIITGPGLQRGQTCDNLVQREDICPTVLEIANQSFPPMPKMGPYLKVEDEDLPQLPGQSLLSLCQGECPSNWRNCCLQRQL